jgi:glyoxylase-like metal-dependent hydrolase (beta-lactamase superfamily II)
MVFILNLKQIKIGSDNFCYVIYLNEKNNNLAAVVDPGFEPEKVINFIEKNNLTLYYIIITHYHSDHSHGVYFLKKEFPDAKIIASKIDGEKIDTYIDLFVNDGDILNLGGIKLEFLLTPGHTLGGICIIIDDKALLTGDTLFIGDCGRTDLPGGDLYEMYKTLKNKIMSLSDKLIVYPGHDYGNKMYDTLGNQKKINKTLNVKNFDDFSKL